jgi:DNA polymerase
MLQRTNIVLTGVSRVTIDIEMSSGVNLTEVGASRYAFDPSTRVRVVVFAIDDAPPEAWIVETDPVPPVRLVEVAADPDVLVVAHNAGFECEICRKILMPRYGLPRIALERWRCTQHAALVHAYPPDLEKLALALGLKVLKDPVGKRLMKQMARPAPPSPDDVVKLTRLVEYCKRDVDVTREAFFALPAPTEQELDLWRLNHRINERGIHFDRALTVAGRDIAQQARPELDAAMAKATAGAITTCNQVKRLIAWLAARGYPVDSVGKNAIELLLANNPDALTREVLELRQAGAVNAVAKFDAILAGLEEDDSARGLFRWHGASTGRASSHRIQVQNLKHTKLEDPDIAIAAVLSGDIEQVRALGRPLELLAQLLRPLVCARPGFVLVGADFSAVESRGLAWIAGEARKLEIYRTYDRTGDSALEPYLMTAKALDPHKPDRGIGKIADLAFGYAGGVKAYRNFEPDKLNPLPEPKVEEFKNRWRAAHPNIVRFWFSIERAAIEAVFRPGVTTRCGRVRFKMIDTTLYMQLPSGRLLAYPQARLEYDNRRRKQVVFKDNASGGWRDDVAYSGQLTENCVSGLCRDLLTAAMLRIDAAGIAIIMHVHDEIVCEVPKGAADPDALVKLMTELPAWADGFPLVAKGWAGRRYAK